MPKIVDYAARFAFLRRAAFVVVLEEGPGALSRRAVAAALGTSVNSLRRLLSEEADLRQLALDEVDRRRVAGRWGRPRGLVGPDLAVCALRTLVPDEEDRVPEELVWLRVALGVRGAIGGDSAGLRAEYAIADRGYLPDDLEAATAVPPRASDEALADRLTEHHAARARVVADALAAIGVHDEQELRRTSALVAGLAIETCLGRTSPDEAVRTLEHHVASLTPTATAT